MTNLRTTEKAVTAYTAKGLNVLHRTEIARAAQNLTNYYRLFFLNKVPLTLRTNLKSRGVDSSTKRADQ